MIVSKIGRRGQITLPSSIRHRLHLNEGDRVAFIPRGEEIVLQPLTQTLLDLRGTVSVSGPQDFETIRQQVRSERGRQVASDET